MKFGSFKNTVVLTTALVASLGLSTSSFAGPKVRSLAPIDSYVKTIVDKSLISGSITGAEVDSEGTPTAYLFEYTGSVHSIDTNEKTGDLETLKEEIGSIEGKAAFPPAFVQLASDMHTYLGTCDEDGNCYGTMPAVPAAMDWTCNHCLMTIGENQYVSIVDAAQDPAFSAMLASHFGDADAAVEAMRMKGRAFTGVTPVEIGKILNPMEGEGLSMSVRMAGCSAIVAVAGPDGPQMDAEGNMIPPMMGTLCLNGTFTFDLNSQYAAGTGSSNCVTVLHRPTM